MTWKQSLAFNNDDGKKLYKTNKSHLPSSNPVHVSFPEIEIKKT